jgi:hypothetical protein
MFEYYNCDLHVVSEVEDIYCASLTVVIRLADETFIPCGFQILKGEQVLYADACKHQAKWLQKSHFPCVSRSALQQV